MPFPITPQIQYQQTAASPLSLPPDHGSGGPAAAIRWARTSLERWIAVY